MSWKVAWNAAVCTVRIVCHLTLTGVVCSPKTLFERLNRLITPVTLIALRLSASLLATILLAASCAGCGTVSSEPTPSVEQRLPPAPAQEDLRELTANERALLADGFAAGLPNPESAKFQWTKVPKNLGSIGRGFDYCGLINVKQDQDGYNGMQPFLATIIVENGNIVGGAVASLDSENREQNREVIPNLCRQRGLNPFDAK